MLIYCVHYCLSDNDWRDEGHGSDDVVLCCAGSVKQAALRGECLSYFVFCKGTICVLCILDVFLTELMS